VTFFFLLLLLAVVFFFSFPTLWDFYMCAPALFMAGKLDVSPSFSPEVSSLLALAPLVGGGGFVFVVFFFFFF